MTAAPTPTDTVDTGDGTFADVTEVRDMIVVQALNDVPFDGWSMTSLRRGAMAAGFDRGQADRSFTDGPFQAVMHFMDLADRLMEQDLAGLDLDQMKIRERIATAVRVRLKRWAPHKEAVRRAAAILSLPQNAPAATRATFRTVSVMWYAAGDTSTDYNWYTKRGLLAGVYSSTLLYWLADSSDDHADTWAFLDRRVEGVMRVGKATARLGQLAERVTAPGRAVADWLARRRGSGDA